MNNKYHLMDKLFLFSVLLIQIIFTLMYFDMNFESEKYFDIYIRKENIPLGKDIMISKSIYSMFFLISWFFAIIHSLFFLFKNKINKKIRIISLILNILIYIISYYWICTTFIAFNNLINKLLGV